MLADLTVKDFLDKVVTLYPVEVVLPLWMER